ncbi:MAG: hypothetical protein JNK05_10130 [Myxococcales bacterium]|nr:hypothetical protein [Myxococcales bacterium]
MATRSLFGFSPLALVLAACAPPDVAGSFSGAITNRDNPCQLAGFTPGAMSSGVTMTVTQSGTNVTVSVEGAARLALAAFVGSTEPMTGSTTGNGFSVRQVGRVPMSQMGCTFNTLVEATARLSGNSLEGTVAYSYQVTDASACGYRATCRTTQDFSFVRPPR